MSEENKSEAVISNAADESNKKSKKGLITLISIAVVGLCVASWFAPFSKDVVRKNVISSYMKIVSMRGYSEDKVEMFIPIYQTAWVSQDIEISKGSSEVGESYFGKLDGFDNPLFHLDKSSFKIDVDSLLTDTIVIEELSLDGLSINIQDSKKASNLEIMFSNIFDFLMANVDNVKKIVMDVDTHNEASLDDGVEKIETILFGDMSKYEEISRKTSIPFFGGNYELISRLEKLSDYENLSMKELESEMFFWMNKNIVIKNIGFSKLALNVGDMSVVLPDLKLTNINVKDIMDTMADPEEVLGEENMAALKSFQTGVMSQEESFMNIVDNFDVYVDGIPVVAEKLAAKIKPAIEEVANHWDEDDMDALSSYFMSNSMSSGMGSSAMMGAYYGGQAYNDESLK